MEIVFFSEGNQHTRFFEPLLDYLIKNNQNKITLITLDETDELIKDNKFSRKLVPKNNIEKIKILKNIEADYFITTTPGIGHSYFPKSKIVPSDRRPKYVYIFHSLVSPNEMYLKNSFKNYDLIFAPSEKIKRQLSTLVSKNTKILVSGYFLFDSQSSHQNTIGDSKNILIAPTWGNDGLITNLDKLEALSNLYAEHKYKLTIRPHPMTFLDKILIKKLEKFNLDTSNEVKNFGIYDFLITDFSGIALEYYFFTRKPTLFIESNKKIKRKIKKAEFKFSLIENEMQEIIGSKFKIDKDYNKYVYPTILNSEKADSFIETFQNKKSSVKYVGEFLLEN